MLNVFVNVSGVDDDVVQIHQAGIPPELAHDHIERPLKRFLSVSHSKRNAVVLERARMTHQCQLVAVLLANWGLPGSLVRVEGRKHACIPEGVYALVHPR